MNDFERHLGANADPLLVAKAALTGTEGFELKLAMTLHMLERVALDPRYAERALQVVELGYVRLGYFGYCNPVPDFELEPGHPWLVQIEQAVRQNMNSRLFDAARRVLAWRARSSQRSTVEYRFANRIRGMCGYPTAQDYKVNSAAANQRAEEAGDLFRCKMAAFRDLRNRRLALLAQAATRVQSWQALMDELLNVQPLSAYRAPDFEGAA